MTTDKQDPREAAIDAYMAIGFSKKEAERALDHPESAWEIGHRVRQRTQGRPKLRRRGCLLGVAVLAAAYLVITAIAGGLFYLVDKWLW